MLEKYYKTIVFKRALKSVVKSL